MKQALKYGELFVKLEDENINLDPVELGEELLIPGMLFSRLGEKDRTAITMQKGYYLEYAGFIDVAGEGKYLLFKEYLQDWKGWLNGLIYIDKNTLLQQTSVSGFRDIKIKHLEPAPSPKPKIEPKQISVFNAAN